MNYLFDYFAKKEIPSLVLCNPYLEPLHSLSSSFNITNTLRYNNLSELEFDYPRSTDNNKTILPAYEKLTAKMVILVEKVGYYVIKECPENSEGMVSKKHVVCQSLESELLHKRLTTLPEGSYFFYSREYPAQSLMTILLGLSPGWETGYIDPDLLGETRMFSIDNTTVYNFMMNDVETAFGCVFSFDTLQRKISAYAIKNLNDEVDTYFSFNNINKSVKLTEYSDELTTAMYCYGGDGLDIRSVNPLGTNVLYNFDYFKTADWMSSDLISALDIWGGKIDEQQPVYSNYIRVRNTNDNTLADQEADLTDYKSNLEALQLEYQLMLAAGSMTSGSTLTDMQKQIKTQRAQITKQNGKIAKTVSKRDSIQNSIDLIVNDLQFTGKECWKNFIYVLTLMAGDIQKMSTSWKATYYANTADIEFDPAQLAEYMEDITGDFKYLNEKIPELLRKVSKQYDSYWTITDDSIDNVINSMNDVIVKLRDLYEIFSALIPDTRNVTVKLNSHIQKLTTYFTIIRYNTNFTQEQYTNLQKFIYQNTYTNSNIKIYETMNEKQRQQQAQSLYDLSVTALERVSVPRYEFEGDFINFLYLSEYKDFITKIDLGKLVTMEIDETKRVRVALLEIKYTYDNPTSFGLVFGNRFKLNDDNFKLADLIISTAGGAGGVSGVTTGGTNAKTIVISNVFNDAPAQGAVEEAGVAKNFNAQVAPPTTNLLSTENAIFSKDGFLAFGINPPKKFGNQQGIYLGWDVGAQFSLYSSDNDYLQWDGTKLLIKAKNFTLDSAGNITATSASLSGFISALGGDIGGWIIGGTSLYSGTGTTFVAMNTSASNPAFYAGDETGDLAPFKVYKNGELFASSVNIAGSVITTTGSIGGWVVNPSTIFVGTGSAIAAMSATGSYPAFFSGSMNPNTAPFRVYRDGSLYATNATIEGEITAQSGGLSLSDAGIEINQLRDSLIFYDGTTRIGYLSTGITSGSYFVDLVNEPVGSNLLSESDFSSPFTSSSIVYHDSPPSFNAFLALPFGNYETSKVSAITSASYTMSFWFKGDTATSSPTWEYYIAYYLNNVYVSEEILASTFTNIDIPWELNSYNFQAPSAGINQMAFGIRGTSLTGGYIKGYIDDFWLGERYYSDNKRVSFRLIGNYLYSDALQINTSNRDIDTSIGSTTTDYLFYADASANRVGINTNNPLYTFHVSGSSFTNTLIVQDRLTVNADSYFTQSLTVSQYLGVGTSPTVPLQVSGTISGCSLILNENGGNFDSRFEGDTDQNLFFLDASVDRIGIGDSTPSYKLDVNGTFRAAGSSVIGGELTVNDTSKFNANATMSGLILGGATISDLDYGTYTPVLSNPTNVSGSTSYLAQYMRLGNIATVSGRVDITATSTALVAFEFSLPIASKFAGTQNCAGTINYDNGGVVGGIRANFVNDTARASFTATSVASQTYYYQYTYRII